jgi:hypothetical protein
MNSRYHGDLCRFCLLGRRFYSRFDQICTWLQNIDVFWLQRDLTRAFIKEQDSGTNPRDIKQGATLG